MTPRGTPIAGLRSALPLLVAGFAISFVVVGGGIDTVGVFLNAIAGSTDWSRSSLSLAVSVGALMAAVATPVVGIAVDRFGVRVPMTAGVTLLGLGFVVLLRMQEPWHFVAANVLLGPGFAACALLPITIAVTVHVKHNTALALGIVSAGSSAGALILAPVLQMVIDQVGWRSAYWVLGAAVVLTPLPFLALTLPRGRLRSGSHRPVQSNTPAALARELRRPGIGPLAAVIILPALAGFSVSVHLVPYLAGLGHSATSAATALGAAIGISAVGKVAGGFLGDRLGTVVTLRLALASGVAALALLSRAQAPAALVAFVALYGLALGTQIALVPAIAITVLGAERFGTLFGVLQLAAMLASGAGPVASGFLFDVTGRYDAAILLWVVTLVVAAAMAFWIPSAGAGTTRAARQAVA